MSEKLPIQDGDDYRAVPEVHEDTEEAIGETIEDLSKRLDEKVKFAADSKADTEDKDFEDTLQILDRAIKNKKDDQLAA